MPRDIWAEGYTDAKSIPDDILFTRIAQTVEWCNSIICNSAFTPSMRSELIIKPSLDTKNSMGNDVQIQNKIYFELEKLVCGIGLSRERNLPSHIEMHCTFPDLKNGRLLIYCPGDDVSDGTSGLESENFFDEFSAPPWDTWIGIFTQKHPNLDEQTEYLLAYVPEQLIDLANQGINVNITACINWLEQEPDNLLHKRLKHHINYTTTKSESVTKKTLKFWWQFWK